MARKPTRTKSQSPKLQEQNDRMTEAYGVQGFPTVLLVDAEGCELARTSYQKGGAGAYVKHLQEKLAEGLANAKESKAQSDNIKITWETSAAAAKKRASEKNQVILAFFADSSSAESKKLEEDVFASSEFKNFAKENVVLLKANFSQGKSQSDNQDLLESYRIKDFPTVYMLTTDTRRGLQVKSTAADGVGMYVSNLKSAQKTALKNQ